MQLSVVIPAYNEENRIRNMEAFGRLEFQIIECSKDAPLLIESEIMELKDFDKMAEFEETYWWWVGKRNIVKSVLNRLNMDHANILGGGCGTGF